jgi:hypothetical protein
MTSKPRTLRGILRGKTFQDDHFGEYTIKNVYSARGNETHLEKEYEDGKTRRTPLLSCLDDVEVID